MAMTVEGLTFRYKADPDITALDAVDLAIERGEFVVIMGPSGAGKSTLANCFNGLIPHFMKGYYEGRVVVAGETVTEQRVSAMARKIGLVFQDFEAQLFSTNVRLELAFGPENFGVARSDIQDRMASVLKTVMLAGYEDHEPATLSGGQKQRLAIGSVLAACPEIICMDEPTSDLDPSGKTAIFSIARELHASNRHTLVMIEHETEEALGADRLMIMNAGKIIRQGPPAQLLREIDLTDRLGMMSLQIPKYFKELLDCDTGDLPLTPDAGYAFFGEKNLTIDAKCYADLCAADKRRESTYGDRVLHVDRLSHVYPNGKRALNEISLTIREREFVAILGPNGSGKTTLVKHFNALLTPSRGEVVICGKNTREHAIFEIGKQIGYVFQNPDHQIFSDTVYDEVAFSPKMRGCAAEEIDARVSEALAAVELSGYEDADPFSLSKGERQRVAVASILSSRPKIIVLDEPTTGLDYKAQRRMMDLIKKLNTAGHTIIMITHTMWVVAEYAHRMVVIENGQLIMDGTTRQVFAREQALQAAHLKAPDIVSLSNRLGSTLLSVEEMKHCTGRC
jgi:energy-coupling factor transport system ATP-binding protein